MGILKAGSVAEIIELIKSKFESLNRLGDIQNLWFRGEKEFISTKNISFTECPLKLEKCSNNSNPYTPLLPNAYRIKVRVEESDYVKVYDEAKTIEGNYKAEFSRNSMMFLNQNRIENNDWNNYFLMQHYGLNTRLLDWTESALVAIYFAVEDYSNPDDSKIWILNPHKLNKSTSKLIKGFETGFSVIYFPQDTEKKNLFDNDRKLDLDGLHRKYLMMDFENDEKAYPLAIYPYLFDERMKVQKACFTIFGNQVNGLLNNPEKESFLKEIIIDGNKKKEIMEELRWLGISEESVYPGLGSTCKAIREKYK